MPNSPALWVAAGMLWIMDASINISMEPFRAFVGDNLPSEQRTMGFAMQSFFIGTGAVIASALPYILTNWFGVPNTAAEGVIPLSVKLSFYIGGVVLLASVLYTVFTSKEYSPEELAAFEQAEEETSGLKSEIKPLVSSHQFLKNGFIWTTAGIIATAIIVLSKLEAQLYIVSGLLLVFGIILLISGALTKKGNTKNGMVAIMNDLLRMPKTMGQLAIVQFFSWLSFYAMWLHHACRNPARFRNNRYFFGTLQQGRRLGGCSFRRLQCRFRNFGFLTAGSCQANWAQGYAFHRVGGGRNFVYFVLLYQRPQYTHLFDDRYRIHLGKHFIHALRHSHGRTSGR